MSKIDLSKANVGDKFRTRGGFIRAYNKCVNYKSKNFYLLKDEDGNKFYYHKYGDFVLDRVSDFDLVEQVFDDEKDRAITDRILKDVEKVVNGVAEAMPHIESTTIANLLRYPLPDSREDETELQRRQEVAELADRIFFSKRGSAYSFKECIEVAEHSVNMINQYLKDGKL